MVWRLALFFAVTGCGRLHFDVLADANRGDGVVVDASSGDASTTCGGTLPATCPPQTGSQPITTGGHVHVSGSTFGLADGRTGSCGGAGSAEFILQLDVGQFGFYSLSTTGSSFDTVIYVLDGGCVGSEFQCMNGVVGTGGEMMTLGLAHAGTFFVVVDGANGCGSVELDIQG